MTTTIEREIVIGYCPRREQAEMHQALEQHRFSVLVAHRRMGKTVCVVNHLIAAALTCARRDGYYAYVAPQRNQAKDIAWTYLKKFTASIPGRTVNETELAIALPNGARIRIYGADNPDALRGIYLDGVVMDEVAQMKPEVWGEVVRPALSDRKGFAVFIGTPKGMNLFHELYQRSLVTPGWYGRIWRVDQTGVIPEEELVAARAELSDAQYRQEFLCDFSASSDDVLITIDLADAASRRIISKDDVRGAPMVIGVDVARFGDDRTVIAKRRGLYAYPLQSWQGLAVDEVADRVASEINLYVPDAVFVDAGGVGGGVADLLRRWNHEVTDVNFGRSARRPFVYYDKRSEMWGDMRDWLKSGGRIPDDPDLKTDLTQPRYGYKGESRIKLESKDSIKARGGKSPDRGDALALTFAAPVRSRNIIFNRMELAFMRNSGETDDTYDPLA
jgi:hypothetical protein